VFTEHLKTVVDQVDGGIGGLIMGLDGIAVDSYVADGNKMDITTLGMEFSFILGQVKKASEILRLGGVNEVTIRAESLYLVVRMINPEYFLAVVLSADGNFGKCRFLMRLAQPRLLAEL
jgi:predicted regulator of Ras-like GTPase activity (Roadblock/LC7/MglB family)